MKKRGTRTRASLNPYFAMRTPDRQQTWEAYRDAELEVTRPLLRELDYELDEKQPHIAGERYLMQAVTTTSGKKLILLGRKIEDGTRAVIKITSDPAGKRELSHERACRLLLPSIRFAYRIFHSPKELFFGTSAGRLIAIQAFIEQESTFLARPLKEQFVLALEAFKAQEGAHATTYGHERLIGKTFGTMHADTYLRQFAKFRENISRTVPTLVPAELLDEAMQALHTHMEIIEQYCGFLTHTDFVPHNIRVRDGKIYLLDHSSLRFGNKYEGWARFVNFMTLYNPPLAGALVEYVRLNRTPEELLLLRLMRVYRLGEIIWYYANTLNKCSGELYALNTERVKFWTRVLEAVCRDEPVPQSITDAFTRKRDALRSADEKMRQKGLH